MSITDSISDEQLNALIDDQLDVNERARVLSAIKSNKELEEKYNKLRQMKEMVLLTYENVHVPPLNTQSIHYSGTQNWRMGVAASVILGIGISLGWVVSKQITPDPAKSFLMVSELDAKSVNSQKVILHVNTMEKIRVEQALDKAELVLKEYKDQNEPLDLEIIANSKGLGLLRRNSPYANRIKDLTAKYSNVSFLACGIAKENARMKEGHEISLLPEATQVPAALDQILKRLKLGWLYVRA